MGGLRQIKLFFVIHVYLNTKIRIMKKVLALLMVFALFTISISAQNEKQQNLRRQLVEQKLQEKFIQVNDTTSSFKRLNSSDYIYIVCQSFTATIQISKDRLEPFNKEFSEYKINKTIYEKEPFTIYEAISRRSGHLK